MMLSTCVSCIGPLLLHSLITVDIASSGVANDNKVGNSCKLNTCLNGGSCSVPRKPDADGQKRAECQCTKNFGGDRCEITLPEYRPSASNSCEPNPCRNGGTCKVQGKSKHAECECITGYGGETCDTPQRDDKVEDPCQPSPCLNGGSCSPNPYRLLRAECDCPEDFGGDRCDVELPGDPERKRLWKKVCGSNPCKNAGVCDIGTKRKFDEFYIDIEVSYYPKCYCIQGFKGKHCETPLGGPCAESCPQGNAKCVPHGKFLDKIKEVDKVDESYMNTAIVKKTYTYSDMKVCMCPQGLGGKACTKSCNFGYFGSSCALNCFTCKYRRCKGITGDCKNGCVKGYIGKQCRQPASCKSKSETCAHGVCLDEATLDKTVEDLVEKFRSKAQTFQEKNQRCICYDGYYDKYCKKKCKVDLFTYGTLCKEYQKDTCSRCKKPLGICSVYDGTCTECKPQYTGKHCEFDIKKNKNAKQSKEETEDRQKYASIAGVTITVDYKVNPKGHISTRSVEEKDEALSLLKNMRNKKRLEKDMTNAVVQEAEDSMNLVGIKGRVDKLTVKTLDRDTRETPAVRRSIPTPADRATDVRKIPTQESRDTVLQRRIPRQEGPDTEEGTSGAHRRIPTQMRQDTVVPRISTHEGGETGRSSVVRKRIPTQDGRNTTQISALHQELPTHEDLDTQQTFDVHRRKPRQQASAGDVRLEAEMTFFLPSEEVVDPDFKENFKSVVQNSADRFQTKVLPGLTMDRNSVAVLQVSVPPSENNVSAIRMTLYVITAILGVAVLVVSVMVIRRIRRQAPKNKSQFYGHRFHPPRAQPVTRGSMRILPRYVTTAV